jgi:uncharacterized protein YndB with AHSA1/START domain
MPVWRLLDRSSLPIDHESLPSRSEMSMLNRSEPACLVIADIAGYTGYLAGTELDHAQDILADLISTVVAGLRPTFRLAKLEGDAAFVFSLTEAVDGSQLQDTIERCYFGFRRRLRDIRQASTCECNACILVPNLDLKFVAHHGLVARQRIASRDELAGSDVIVVHRLLKNHVEASLGQAAYALYTDACVRAMGLEDPDASGLVRHVETFEGVGEIGGWVRDLESAWAAEEAGRRVVVSEKDAIFAWTETYPAPPPIVWEWVTSPLRRPEWQHGVTAIIETEGGGRRGIGSVNHCMHGKDAIVEEILDWRPFEYHTMRSTMPDPSIPKVTLTWLFEPIDRGTRVVVRALRPRSAKDRSALEAAGKFLAESIQKGLDALQPLIAADIAARAAEQIVEPDVPVGTERFLTEPVGAGVR